MSMRDNVIHFALSKTEISVKEVKGACARFADERTIPHLAEDLIDESPAVILEAIRTFDASKHADPGKGLRRWVFMALRDHSLKVARKHGVRAEKSRKSRKMVSGDSRVSNDSTRTIFDAMPDRKCPLRAVLAKEAINQIAGALDDKGRAVLALALEGYTQREIAARVGFSVFTVNNRVQRIRALAEVVDL